jgi:hypothetical protein
LGSTGMMVHTKVHDGVFISSEVNSGGGDRYMHEWTAGHSDTINLSLIVK